MITAIVSGVEREQFDIFLDRAVKAAATGNNDSPIYIGSEYEIVIELYDSETDETLKGAKALAKMVALRLEASNRAMEKSGEG